MSPSRELRVRVARRIRQLAEARGIPLTHLADRAGVSRAHMWSILYGEKAATIDWLAKVASELEVDPAELLARPESGAPKVSRPRIPAVKRKKGPRRPA